MMSQSIFPPINFLIQNSALLTSYAAQKALSNGHPSGSSLAALEKLSKAFRRPEIHIEKLASSCIDKQKDMKMSNVVPSRNRYGRPYISGRPLLTCDRQKIVECYKKGMKKIHIAKQLGITHSCVSKVLRRYAETGEIVAKACRTASCSCPGSAEEHDARYCKHLQDNTIRLFFSIEKYAETGEIVAKACRTASCSCPGSAEEHDARYCKHLQDNTIRLFFSIENLLRSDSTSSRVVYFSKHPSSSSPTDTVIDTDDNGSY